MRSSRRSGTPGSMLFLRTDRDAPNRKVIAIDTRRSDPAAWKTIVPEGSSAIENVALLGGRIVVEYLDDVKSRLADVRLSTASGWATSRCPGPARCPASTDVQDSRLMFYAFTSPLYPTTVFAHDSDLGEEHAVRSGQSTDRCAALRDRAAVRARRRTARACRSS